MLDSLRLLKPDGSRPWYSYQGSLGIRTMQKRDLLCRVHPVSWTLRRPSGARADGRKIAFHCVVEPCRTFSPRGSNATTCSPPSARARSSTPPSPLGSIIHRYFRPAPQLGYGGASGEGCALPDAAPRGSVWTAYLIGRLR